MMAGGREPLTFAEPRRDVRIERRLRSRGGCRSPFRSARSSSPSCSRPSSSSSRATRPIETFRRLFDSAFLAEGAMSATLVSATPLVFTGLCAAAAFRMNLFNIGGEGQLYMGAVLAAAVAIATGGRRPRSSSCDVRHRRARRRVWALIPGVLRAFFATNEIITSLMLNYVAALSSTT